MFNKNTKMYSRTAASQVGLNHETMWNFLKNELKSYPNKLQMHEEINNLEQNRTELRDTIKKIGNNSELLRRVLFFNNWKFLLSAFLNIRKSVRNGVQNVQMKFGLLPNIRRSVMVWYTVSEEALIKPYFFKIESVTEGTYNWLLRYYAFPKLYQVS